MAFRMITQRLVLARRILASIDALKDDVREGLQTFFSDLLQEGETAPDMNFCHILVGRRIEKDLTQLATTDQEHSKQLRKGRLIRQRRDKTMKQLYQALLRVRQAYEGVFGAGTSSLLAAIDPGLHDVSAVTLIQHAREALDMLFDPSVETPDGPSGALLNPQEMASAITPLLEALEAVLTDLDLQQKMTEKALKEKRKALDTFNLWFGRSSRYLEAFYNLAGEDFHSDRLRPLTRSRSSAGEEDEGPIFGDDSGEGGEGEPVGAPLG